jgi:thymidylate synthase (FAD)
VLEHASVTFRIGGVSRVLTHELVRHRIASFSQESQRYVTYADNEDRPKTKDFGFVVPDTIKEAGIFEDADFSIERNGEKVTITDVYNLYIDRVYAFYEHMLKCGVPPEDARYILPNATTTEIVMTMNFRELRHFLEVRGNPRAHWEIRRLAVGIYKQMLEHCPNVLFDFVLSTDGQSLELK